MRPSDEPVLVTNTARSFDRESPATRRSLATDGALGACARLCSVRTKLPGRLQWNHERTGTGLGPCPVPSKAPSRFPRGPLVAADGRQRPLARFEAAQSPDRALVGCPFGIKLRASGSRAIGGVTPCPGPGTGDTGHDRDVLLECVAFGFPCATPAHRPKRPGASRR